MGFFRLSSDACATLWLLVACQCLHDNARGHINFLHFSLSLEGFKNHLIILMFETPNNQNLHDSALQTLSGI